MTDPAKQTPDVGDIVLYHGTQWAVISWLREVTPDPKVLMAITNPDSPEVDVQDVFKAILYQAQREIQGKKMGWCRREEATHLSLAGVGGTLAPIEEVEVVGRTDWPESHIEEIRASANRMARNREVVF